MVWTARTWANVDKTAAGGCWLWTGWKTAEGYGRSGNVYTHRAVWMELVGPIPEGLWLDHLCRVPACCNPDHLEVVTPQTNALRGLGAHVYQTGRCKRGHEITAETSYTFRTHGGKYLARCCRICKATRDEAYQQRQKTKRQQS